jgi:hypothetical protein
VPVRNHRSGTDHGSGPGHRSGPNHTQASGLHWNVVYRHLEDMTAVGVIDALSQFDERDHRWRLRGEEGDLIRKVVGG